MFKSLQILYFIPFLLPIWLSGQSDSVALEAKKLGVHDIIKPIDNDKDKIKIISGSRFPIAAGELPFSVHVITKEEIRQNGYETLVDALKMAPGIFTSQPGSALEGETFLMRGLLGNSYTKILVNDIPIKPAFLASMPVGAQLPIREAERIEIIYGAGASLYGADASAGIINIITRQSDKPVYMQADLAVGAGEYSSVNVMFGGKWGRDKNILHYFAYGSNVLYEDRYIKRNFQTDFNTNTYPWLTLGSDFFKSVSNNYQEETSGEPTVNNTPHLSRKFGLNLKFRRYSLSLETMTRRDHSSIGLSPVSVTYGNPLTYTGETIQRINLNLYKEKEKMNRKTDITAIVYRMDANASIAYVQPRLAIELYNLARVEAFNTDPQNVDDLQKLFYTTYYNKYFSGTRYMFAASDEIRFEHVRNYRLFKTSSLTLGWNGKYSAGIPATNFLLKPPNDICSGLDIVPSCSEMLEDPSIFPVTPKILENTESNLFGQIFYAAKKFNIVAGFNYSSFSKGELTDAKFEKVFLPRVAGLVKLTESINIRSSWGKAYRSPNAFYNSNSYLISNNEPDEITSSPFDRLEAETTTSWESGIRFLSGKNVDFDFTYFINETENLISYGRIPYRVDDKNYEVGIGYGNALGSTIKYQGGQLSTLLSFGDKIEATYRFSWTKSNLDNAGFVESYFLPQYSGKIHQWRIQVKPFKTTTLILDYRKVKRNQLENTNFVSGQAKFSTIDLVGRYAFNDRFDCYFKATNLLDKQYAGILASRTPDDLIQNTQYGTFLKIGMNYYIE